MNPAEVLAVEIRHYTGQGMRGLIPRVIGQTAVADRKSTSSSAAKRQWDRESFLSELEAKQGQEAGRIARRTLEWAGVVAFK